MSSRWACSCRLGKAVAFLLQLAVFRPCNGGSFARATKSPRSWPRNIDIDFLRRQVMMTRTVRDLVIDVAVGGRDHQIE